MCTRFEKVFGANIPNFCVHFRSVLIAEGSMFRVIEVDIATGETLKVFSKSGTLGAVDNIRASENGAF